MSDSEQSNASEQSAGSDVESVNSGSRFVIFENKMKFYIISHNLMKNEHFRSRSASRSRSRSRSKSGSDSDAAAAATAAPKGKKQKKNKVKKRELDDEEEPVSRNVTIAHFNLMPYCFDRRTLRMWTQKSMKTKKTMTIARENERRKQTTGKAFIGDIFQILHNVVL